MGFIPTNKVTQQAIKAVAVDASSSDFPTRMIDALFA